MKKISFGLLLLASAALTMSCDNHQVRMHTIVNADGTCKREVSYSNVMSQHERDSLWGVGKTGWAQPLPAILNIDAFSSSHTDVGEGDTVTTTFWREFDNAEQMSAEIPLQLGNHRLQSQASLKKRFRWFYTDYTYTETFACVGDTFELSPADYADQDVVSYWFTGQPNIMEGLSGSEAKAKLDEIEPTVTKWLNDNFFKTSFDFIVSHYDSIANPPVSRERFVQLHDSLAKFVLTGSPDLLDIEPSKKLQQFFHSDAYAPFFNEETPLGRELNDIYQSKMNIFLFSVPYTLQMPGTVIDAGTGSCREGVIYYSLTGERLIPHDYVISATSRVTHIWAYLLTLLVILAAIWLWKGRGYSSHASQERMKA